MVLLHIAFIIKIVILPSNIYIAYCIASICIFILFTLCCRLPFPFTQSKCLRNPGCICNSQFLQFTVATEEVVIIARIRKKGMFHNNSWNA